MPRRTPRLGQGELMPTEFGPPPVTDQAPVQELTETEASSFASLWQQFTQLWPEVLSQRQQILDQRERWRALARAAYDAGDLEGFRAYSQRITALDALEADRQEAESLVGRFREVWETLRTYLLSAGRWLGISSLGGLGLPPLVLAVGIPAALGALAWVVNTVLRIREELAVDRQLLEAAERGVLTPQQAAEAIARRERGGGALLSLGGGAWSGLLVIGAVLIGLWLVAGGRR